MSTKEQYIRKATRAKQVVATLKLFIADFATKVDAIELSLAQDLLGARQKVRSDYGNDLCALMNLTFGLKSSIEDAIFKLRDEPDLAELASEGVKIDRDTAVTIDLLEREVANGTEEPK